MKRFAESKNNPLILIDRSSGTVRNTAPPKQLDADATALLAKISSYVERSGSINFAELANNWPDDFRHGDYRLGFAERNVFHWQGVTDRGADVFSELTKRFDLQPADLLSYVWEGAVLRWPLVTENRRYKEPHWAPVVLVKRAGASKRLTKEPAP